MRETNFNRKNTMTINPVKRWKENQEYKRHLMLLDLKFENQLITYAKMDQASKASKL